MAPSESLPISLTRCDRISGQGDARCTIVWVAGEHDAATKLALAAVIDRAAELDHADVLVDLSKVTFMDASIVGTLVGARNRLKLRSHSLEVRAPSHAALFVLELCGLKSLVHATPEAELHPHGAAAALGTWVDVPANSSLEAEPAHAVEAGRGRR